MSQSDQRRRLFDAEKYGTDIEYEIYYDIRRLVSDEKSIVCMLSKLASQQSPANYET